MFLDIARRAWQPLNLSGRTTPDHAPEGKLIYGPSPFRSMHRSAASSDKRALTASPMEIRSSSCRCLSPAWPAPFGHFASTESVVSDGPQVTSLLVIISLTKRDMRLGPVLIRARYGAFRTKFLRASRRRHR
jgi:hypothetical protein